MNEATLLVSFPDVISEDINNRVIALHNAFSAGYFTGLVETVPAYASLAVYYDPVIIKKFHPEESSAYAFVKQHATDLLNSLETIPDKITGIPIRIPVHYNGEDLAELAALHKITVDELISLHTGADYRVYMIGFMPGFAYMGKLNEKIATPRKATPRTRVPAGAVGIAGSQTGIYPFSTPGGWQLIGTTPIKIFDAENAQPVLLKAGDTVRFFSIDAATYNQLNEH